MSLSKQFITAGKLASRNFSRGQVQSHIFPKEAIIPIPQRFEGKVAIITGSTNGIGLATARQMGREGCSIVVSSRNQDNVDRAVKDLMSEGLSVMGVKCDVIDAQERENLVQNTLKHFGAIDILLNCAGANPNMDNPTKYDEKKWNEVFDVNLKAPFYMSQLCIPEMMKRGQGSIVHLGSITGVQPVASLGPYGVSRATLVMLTKVMSNELAEKNIRVNLIAPGIPETAFSTKGQWQETASHINVKKLGVPEEVSGIASFLCSDESSFLTGEIIVAAGDKQQEQQL